MSTVVFNAYSSAYPTITNRIRAAVYLQSSPQAFIASQIDTTAGHPIRTWSFPGLPRANYGFVLDEIDGSGNVVNNLAKFDAVPAELEDALTRGDEQIRVDTTPGFNSGLDTVVFDGTSGTPDYRGWEITPSELTGRGIMAEGLDYSWDKDTGTFSLLQTGDILSSGTYYNIHFDPISSIAGNSVATVIDFSIQLLTEDADILAEDFGQKIIVEPASVFVTLTLPDIATVPDGRKLMIEVGSDSVCCVKVVQQVGQIINFLRGNIFVLPNESISIYKFTRSAGVYEWRCCDTDGNFKTCGQLVGDDMVFVFNKQLLNGEVGLITQYARIYNEIVLNLPLDQVVNYDVWATGNNKYFYSFANSVNPVNAGKFHFPDRRGIVEKNVNTGKAGDFEDWQMADHQHEGTSGTLPTSLFGRGGSRTVGKYNGSGVGQTDLTSKPTDASGTLLVTNTGSEVKVKNYSINKYVVL